jgi:aminomethyltransferase
MTTLQRTPLYPLYAPAGAKVIDFGGWELPVQFSSIIQEHEAVRNRAGLFDVSHMGEVLVDGNDALQFLQKVTTNDVAALRIGQAQYSLMCYPDGGVVDDLLVYRLAEQSYMLVINAANIEKDVQWLQQHQVGDVQLRNISEETAMLALQGPAAERILQRLTTASLQTLPSFHFLADVELQADESLRALISRTGYTGEDGFELYVKRDDAALLWQLLVKAGAAEEMVLAGLGARDTLRFEAKLPLYGQELSSTITPLEAGLGYFVKLNKESDFIGKQALAEQKVSGVPRKLVGIEMLERGIPRTGYAVYVGEQKIGEVTTGTQSPTLKKNVGLALIASQYAELGSQVSVEIRGKQVQAVVVKAPFYKRK